MKKTFTILMGSFVLPLACLLGANASAQKVEAAQTEELDIRKVSKAFGHLIGQNLGSLGLDFDMKEVIQGIQDCMNGSPSPMTEAECIKAISTIQDGAFQKQCAQNLKLAEEFLSRNKTQEGVIEIEANRLQYICLQKGEGEPLEEHFSPIIKYTGSFIDGKVFGESQQGEVISLDETIPGFKKALIGMKEGEKRKVFIHPDVGYGTTPGYLPPNSLLIFEVELVRLNAPKAEETNISQALDLDHHSIELADSGNDTIR